MRTSLAIACCIFAGLALGACESTQTKSARLAKTGNGKASLSTVSTGAANTAVKVGQTALLSANGLHAAVVELDNHSRAAEVSVPVLIDVKDAKGASVYRNDIKGLQPSLQELAFLGKGKKVYWVNDQVLAASAPPKSFTVRVGQATGSAPRQVPRIVLTKTRLDSDSSGIAATGVVTNYSAIVERNVPIFAVALRDGKVVAAGRALVPRLDPQPTKKPIEFRIYFVGDPKGAQLRFAVAPTAMKESAG